MFPGGPNAAALGRVNPFAILATRVLGRAALSVVFWFIRFSRAPAMKAREPVHPIKASLVSWVAEVWTLSSWSGHPQDHPFMAPVRLFIASTEAAESETSQCFFRASPCDASRLATGASLFTPAASLRRPQALRTSDAKAQRPWHQTYGSV